jgi:hypothetical protein
VSGTSRSLESGPVDYKGDLRFGRFDPTRESGTSRGMSRGEGEASGRTDRSPASNVIVLGGILIGTLARRNSGAVPTGSRRRPERIARSEIRRGTNRAGVSSVKRAEDHDRVGRPGLTYGAFLP